MSTFKCRGCSTQITIKGTLPPYECVECGGIIFKDITEPEKKSDPVQYAKVVWTAYDVQTLKEDWSLEKCEEWLTNNERRIQDRLIELGWDVMGSLIRD